MGFDLLIFFFFLIFGISFVINLFRVVRKQMRDAIPEPAVPRTAAPKGSDRAERIQRERDELRYGFPTPPPRGDWIRNRPVIRTGAHGTKQAPVQGSTPVAEEIAEAVMLAEQTPAMDEGIPAREAQQQQPIEQLLEGKHPVVQGVLMSVILSKPKAMRREVPAAERFKQW